MRHVLRGLAWVASAEAARQLTQFFNGLVLARLLTPADFGLMAMAMFVLGFVQTIGAFALTQAAVQREVVSDEEWSSIYWLSVASGVLVGALAWLAAPAATAFYGDERVGPLLRVIAWVPLAKSFGATVEARLSRSLLFRPVALAEWTGAVAGGATGIIMALNGLGVASLAAGSLAAAFATSLLFHFYGEWRPRLTISRATLRWAFRFGLGLQGFSVLNYFNRNLDDALIGRYIGPVALGHYARAYQLMAYPISNVAGTVGRVMFPALAQIGGDLPRFRAAYLQAVSAIATITFPAMLGLFITAPEVISVVYGPQWVPAVPLTRALCLVGVLHSVVTTVGWIYMARNRTTLMMAWVGLATPVTVAAFVVGMSWGVMGVAVAYAAANVVLLVPALLIPFRLVQLSLKDLVRALRGAIIGALVMAAVVALARVALLSSGLASPLVLTFSIAVGVCVYLAWLWITDDPILRKARGALSSTA